VHARGGHGLTRPGTDEMFPPLERDALIGAMLGQQGTPGTDDDYRRMVPSATPGARAPHRHLRRDAGNRDNALEVYQRGLLSHASTTPPSTSSSPPEQ
jgi:hypothetical protein